LGYVHRNAVRVYPDGADPTVACRVNLDRVGPGVSMQTIYEVLSMIRGYSAHAANERTFLAWVRTGIAVIAFGFVIEKFNLFLLTIAGGAASDAALRTRFEWLSRPLGHYEGLALIFGGVAIVVLATTRFLRTTRLLDDPETHSANDVRTELILSAALVLLAATYSIYLAFD
jgi:putative membrane protein